MIIKDFKSLLLWKVLGISFMSEHEGKMMENSRRKKFNFKRRWRNKPQIRL